MKFSTKKNFSVVLMTLAMMMFMAQFALADITITGTDQYDQFSCESPLGVLHLAVVTNGNRQLTNIQGHNLVTIQAKGADDHIQLGECGSASFEVYAGSGDDVITASPTAAIIVYGEDGEDRVIGSDQNDYISGGDDFDEIIARKGDDEIHGGAGNDEIYGGDGEDEIYGDAGSDTIEGGIDKDIIRGGDDVDYIYGEDGNDILYGDSGYDEIVGGKGDDEIYGGDGNDDLFGDGPLPNDPLMVGDDTISGGNGADYIQGGEGEDTITGDAGTDTILGNKGEDSIEGGADGDIIYGGAGDDTLKGDSGVDTIYGDADNDLICGGKDGDFLYGGAGSDDIGGEGGDDLIAAGGNTGDRAEGHHHISGDSVVGCPVGADCAQDYLPQPQPAGKSAHICYEGDTKHPDHEPFAFLRGDANHDGSVDISDGIRVINWYSLGGAGFLCDDAADANDDGVVDLSDATYILTYYSQGGSAPPAPFPTAGYDTTVDSLLCSGPGSS